MKDKIIEILYRWASGKGTNLPKIDMRKAPDIADDIIAELSRLKEEPDINTPFFGNTGVKVPVKEKPVLSPEEWLRNRYASKRDMDTEFVFSDSNSLADLLNEFAHSQFSEKEVTDEEISDTFKKALIHIKENKVINESVRKKIYKGLKSAFKEGHISIHSTYENVIDVITKAMCNGKIKPNK